MSKYRGLAALIATSLLWATSFPAIKIVVSIVHEYTYTWLRSLLAMLGLTPYIILYIVRKRGLSGRVVKGGLLAGIAYALGLWLQGWGTRYTTASNSAFITGLNMVFVHIYTGVVLRRYSLRLALSLLLALVGLYYLTMPSTGFNIGDLLVLLGAFTWAAQVIIVDRFSQENPLVFTFFEMAPALAFIIPDMLFNEAPSIQVDVFLAILYLAIICSDTAFALQVYGQKYIIPATAAIIYLLEPVAATFFAYIVLRETMNTLQAIGAVIILASMFTAALDKTVAKTHNKDTL
ncbi:MAG: DMT family transporter [Desulfurococcales archaeon]|nr:DMT family transporter [Desulfurococcales archaeon]